MTGQVHTMLFQWSQAQGGAAAVRTSLPEPDRELWHDRLLPRLSLPSRQHTTGSTCYLRYGIDMVMLHRWPVRDGHQRASTRTRALIGPAELLAFGAAVAVRTDHEPHGDGPFQAVPPGWLDVSDDEDTFRKRAEACEPHITTFIAGMLAAGPDRNYAVVAPEPYRRILLWAAHRCFTPAQRTSWTFSTAETNAAGEDLPGIVFVPASASSHSSWDGGRSWIDVTNPSSIEARWHIDAGLYVDEVLRGTVVPAARPLDDRPFRAAPSPYYPATVRAPLVVPPQMATPPVPTVALSPSPTPTQYQYVERPRTRTERLEYSLFVFLLTLSSLAFLVFLMLAGAW